MVAATIWGLTAEIAPSCPQPQAPLVHVSQLPLEATRGAHELEAEPATRPRRDPQAGGRAGGEGLTARAGEQILSQGEAYYTTGLSRRVSGTPAHAPGHLRLLSPMTRTKHRSRGPRPARKEARVLSRGQEPRAAERLGRRRDQAMGWGKVLPTRLGAHDPPPWAPSPLIGQDTTGSVCAPVLSTPTTQHRRARLSSRLGPGSLRCGRGVGLRGTRGGPSPRGACSCRAASAASPQVGDQFPFIFMWRLDGKGPRDTESRGAAAGARAEGGAATQGPAVSLRGADRVKQQGEAAAADSADTKSRRTLEEGVSQQATPTSITLACGKRSSRGAEGGPWRGAWCRLPCISRSPLPTTSWGVGRGSGDVGRVAGVSLRRTRWRPCLPVRGGLSENHGVRRALLPPLPVVGRGGPG